LYFELQKPKKVEINFDGDGGANHTLYLQQIKNSETTKTKAEREKTRTIKLVQILVKIFTSPAQRKK